jgi:predicted XRE-type DNA-binding protein
MSGWTTSQLTFRLRIDQPRISDLRRGRLERFSLERLIRLVHEMGWRVELTLAQGRRARRDV